jgi:hypothetical protein
MRVAAHVRFNRFNSSTPEPDYFDLDTPIFSVRAKLRVQVTWYFYPRVRSYVELLNLERLNCFSFKR